MASYEELKNRYITLLEIDDEVKREFAWANAEGMILDYTNRVELPFALFPLVVELAKFNQTNAINLGITSRSEGAISESYQDLSSTGGIPATISKRLDRYKLLHVVKHK